MGSHGKAVSTCVQEHQEVTGLHRGEGIDPERIGGLADGAHHCGLHERARPEGIKPHGMRCPIKGRAEQVAHGGINDHKALAVHGLRLQREKFTLGLAGSWVLAHEGPIVYVCAEKRAEVVKERAKRLII
ncbi:MAG: hypothetical protein QW392_10560 [Candidatus Jordarchaeales archaeon]